MQDFSITSRDIVVMLLLNRGMIKTQYMQCVLDRYHGSLVDILGSFFYRQLILVVYSFIFKVCRNIGCDFKTFFALLPFAGLMIFKLHSFNVGVINRRFIACWNEKSLILGT